MNDSEKKYRHVADQARRDELIVSHLPLVKHVLARVVADLPRGVDVDNLESAGVLGLVEAAGNFDPTRSNQFKTYAYIRVRGAILDELRRNCPLPQKMTEMVTRVRQAYRKLHAPVTVESLSRETKLTIEEVVDVLSAMRITKMVSWEQTALPNGLGLAKQVEPPDADLDRKERSQQLTEAIESLPQRDRAVVSLYYRDELRLKEIGEAMGLSESRVSRILSAAMFELGEKLRARGIS